MVLNFKKIVFFSLFIKCFSQLMEVVEVPHEGQSGIRSYVIFFSVPVYRE